MVVYIYIKCLLNFLVYQYKKNHDISYEIGFYLFNIQHIYVHMI